jgi:hypothetical protein
LLASCSFTWANMPAASCTVTAATATAVTAATAAEQAAGKDRSTADSVQAGSKPNTQQPSALPGTNFMPVMRAPTRCCKLGDCLALTGWTAATGCYRQVLLCLMQQTNSSAVHSYLLAVDTTSPHKIGVSKLPPRLVAPSSCYYLLLDANFMCLCPPALPHYY